MSKMKVKYFGAVKHCVFGDCVSDSRFDRPGFNPSTRFYIFPQPCLTIRKLGLKNFHTCTEHLKVCKYCQTVEEWVKSCKSKRFTSIANITKDTYICDRHFLQKYNKPKDIDIFRIFPRSYVEIMRHKNETEETGSQLDPYGRRKIHYVVCDENVVDSNDIATQSQQEDPLALNVLPDPLALHNGTVNSATQTPRSTQRDAICQTTFTFKDEEALRATIQQLKIINARLCTKVRK